MRYYYNLVKALVYAPFFEDFGPLNLAMTHKFSMEVDKIMNVLNDLLLRIKIMLITRSIIILLLIFVRELTQHS